LNSSQKTGEYLDNLFSQGFLPLITKPTRVTSHSATLIDHIYTNRKDIHAISDIVTTDISEHFAIFSLIEYPKNVNIPKLETKLSRSFSQSNINTFNTLLNHIDYTPVLESNCVNTVYDKFMEHIRHFH